MSPDVFVTYLSYLGRFSLLRRRLGLFCFLHASACVYRNNVELKKVNTKYVLKSTLTPTLHRKQTMMERCRSCPDMVEEGRKPQTEITALYVSQQPTSPQTQQSKRKRNKATPTTDVTQHPVPRKLSGYGQNDISMTLL